ncbi:3-oxoacyl-[acyl-carrier-protein] reductase FabG [compost metagenome]
MFLNGKSDAEVSRMAAMAPLGRLGRPGEIADLVAYLASDGAAWINGQVIRANGGIA